MMESVYITVYRDGWSKGLQLSIDTEHHGYRLHGPKFNGSSQELLHHKVSERDAHEIRCYLDRVCPDHGVTSAADVIRPFAFAGRGLTPDLDRFSWGNTGLSNADLRRATEWLRTNRGLNGD